MKILQLITYSINHIQSGSRFQQLLFLSIMKAKMLSDTTQLQPIKTLHLIWCYMDQILFIFLMITLYSAMSLERFRDPSFSHSFLLPLETPTLFQK